LSAGTLYGALTRLAEDGLVAAARLQARAAIVERRLRGALT
jgi:hypothetical protein